MLAIKRYSSIVETVLRRMLPIYLKYAAGVFLVVLGVGGCTHTDEYRAFTETRDSIQAKMTIAEVFDSGLSNYLTLLEAKNITGSTLLSQQPASDQCSRYVMDIRRALVEPGLMGFRVSLFCNSNLPTSNQLVPAQSFSDKRVLSQALDTTYSGWSKSMKFRVESPAKYIGGGYDHYEFTIDSDGRVSDVSPIVSR